MATHVHVAKSTALTTNKHTRVSRSGLVAPFRSAHQPFTDLNRFATCLMGPDTDKPLFGTAHATCIADGNTDTSRCVPSSHKAAQRLWTAFTEMQVGQSTRSMVTPNVAPRLQSAG